jgi:hypothetical protein
VRPALRDPVCDQRRSTTPWCFPLPPESGRPELEGIIVPSKFYGIAAAGRPVIAISAKDGEIARLVERNACARPCRRACRGTCPYFPRIPNAWRPPVGALERCSTRASLSGGAACSTRSDWSITKRRFYHLWRCPIFVTAGAVSPDLEYSMLPGLPRGASSDAPGERVAVPSQLIREYIYSYASGSGRLAD